MDYSIQNINGLIMRSKLIAPENVRAFHERWLSEGKNHVESSKHYLKWLVKNNQLTEYQASLIGKGRVNDFFLNNYKILERLGKGRMAGVYKAEHETGQVVAVKVLPPSKAKDANLLARFQREARLSMKLKHPNVVRAFQVGLDRGLHYIVMEYLDGETLEETLNRRKNLPPKEAVRLVYQALQGLQHICDQGMIHRDMKPANIMLVPTAKSTNKDTTQSIVKILDIGLGREFFDEDSVIPSENVELTTEGVLLGTPDYLAPEQARDPRNIDIRADIYSMGCVFYHMLAGQPPFPDKSVVSQMVRHATEDPKMVKSFSPDVPDGLQQILNWMLAKKPEQRYPTPLRAAQAMQVFMVVGAEARPIEEAPQMKRFMTVLEMGDKEAPKATPVAKPDAAPKMGLPANEPPTAKAKPATPPPQKAKKPKKERKKPHKEPKPKPVPAAVPVPEEDFGMGDVDVELVAAPPEGASPPLELVNASPPNQGFFQSRKGWILLGAGIFLIIAAVILGYGLAKFL